MLNDVKNDVKVLKRNKRDEFTDMMPRLKTEADTQDARMPFPGEAFWIAKIKKNADKCG